jgi:hypothetical protein
VNIADTCPGCGAPAGEEHRPGHWCTSSVPEFVPKDRLGELSVRLASAYRELDALRARVAELEELLSHVDYFTFVDSFFVADSGDRGWRVEDACGFTIAEYPTRDEAIADAREREARKKQKEKGNQ